MQAPAFRERLTPPWWAWLLALGFAGSVGLVYAAPFSAAAGAGAALVTFVVLAALLVLGPAVVEVDDAELRAGRAHIPRHFLADVAVLDRDAAARLRGPGADPRAWMLLRSWIPTAVRIDLDDPDDPTPYWFVSTRRPQELVRALTTTAAPEAGSTP